MKIAKKEENDNYDSDATVLVGDEKDEPQVNLMTKTTKTRKCSPRERCETMTLLKDQERRTSCRTERKYF